MARLDVQPDNKIWDYINQKIESKFPSQGSDEHPWTTIGKFVTNMLQDDTGTSFANPMAAPMVGTAAQVEKRLLDYINRGADAVPEWITKNIHGGVSSLIDKDALIHPTRRIMTDFRIQNNAKELYDAYFRKGKQWGLDPEQSFKATDALEIVPLYGGFGGYAGTTPEHYSKYFELIEPYYRSELVPRGRTADIPNMSVINPRVAEATGELDIGDVIRTTEHEAAHNRLFSGKMFPGENALYEYLQSIQTMSPERLGSAIPNELHQKIMKSWGPPFTTLGGQDQALGLELADYAKRRLIDKEITDQLANRFSGQGIVPSQYDSHFLKPYSYAAEQSLNKWRLNPNEAAAELSRFGFPKTMEKQADLFTPPLSYYLQHGR